MSKIHGSLHVTNNDWRYVYNTVINYFNQEIGAACKEAISFYQNNNTLTPDDFLRKLNSHFEQNEITAFRKSLIKNSLIKVNSKITKPKKICFLVLLIGLHIFIHLTSILILINQIEPSVYKLTVLMILINI